MSEANISVSTRLSAALPVQGYKEPASWLMPTNEDLNKNKMKNMIGMLKKNKEENMLEGVVARVLNSLLGKYVQEFDAESLNVGIFGGDVTLRDLKLKPSCLYELELPVEVVSGVIGELTLKIPWRSLEHKPSHVAIEDLFIIAHPLGLVQFDAARVKELVRAAKRRVLERVEDTFDVELQTLLQGLVPLLGHTVHLRVRNVHVRYEDPRTAVAMGFFVQEFSVETTNSKWKPISQQSGNSTYQLARVEALSAYLNAGLDISHTILQDAQWIQHMRTALIQFQVKGAPLDFVVKPLNAKLKVILGRGETEDGAPLLVDVVIQDAVVVLSHRQLKAAVSVMDLHTRIPLYRDFLHLRPASPIKGHSAEWWRYASAAVVQQRVQPYSWTKTLALRRSYRAYKDLYMQAVLRPGDMELRLDLQLAEDALPIHCLVIAREHAKLELRGKGSDVVEVEETVPGSGQYRLQVTRAKPADSKLFIEHKMNVTLENFSCSLVRDGREVLSVGLTQCLCSVQTYAHGVWKLSARAGNILVEGACPDSELVPLLASPVNAPTGTAPYTCFSLDVEKKPQPDGEAFDHAISITLMPMELIYQEHAFSELLTWAPDIDWSGHAISFWRESTGTDEWGAISELGVAPGIDWGSYLSALWHDATSTTASSHWCQAPRWDVRASIALPRIVLPESGCLQKSGLVLVVDLGKWDVSTELQPRLSADEVTEMTQMELEERLYHRLLVHCSDLQILFTDSGEEWRDLARRDASEAHLVSRMRGTVALSLSIKPEYRLLPRLKLNVGVPAIHVSISERRAQQLLELLETIPRPKAHYVMFVPPPPLDPSDRVPTEPTICQLSALACKMIALELSRQRTPDSLASPMGVLGGVASLVGVDLTEMGVSVRSILSETSASDEELELWARTLDLPGFEDNVSPNNNINALLRATMGELVLHLPRSVAFQDKPYLMIRLARLSVDIALMQYGPAVQAALGGLQLIDKLHIGPSGEYLEVVSTQSDLDLLTLLYRKVRADCPDFKSHFHSVEQSLVVDVGRLSLVLQRDACQAIHKYLQDITKSAMERPVWNCLPETWRTGLKFPAKTMCGWVRGSSEDPPVPPGGTKYSYSAHISELRIRLREADVDLLELNAGGLEGDCAQRANERLVLRLFLQKFGIDDLTDVTLYPHVIALDEDNVLEVKLVHLSPGSRRGPAHGTLKVVLGRFHVLLAAHVLHSAQRVGGWSSIMRRASNGWVRLSPLLNGPLQLSLTLHLPTLLLPPGPAAPSLLILNLGDLSVENFLKEDGAGSLMDNILVRLENVFLTRGLMTLGGNVESREEIIEPSRISLDVKRVLSGVPMLDVVARVDAIRVAVGQRDLALFLDVFAANKSMVSFLDVKSFLKKGEEPVELRSLEAFLRDGNLRRRDSTIRFTSDSLTLTLYTDMDEQLSSPMRDLNHALCKFHLQDGIAVVETRTSGICEFRLSIHNCTLEDVRPDPGVLIARIFGPRPGGDRRLDSAISVSSPPLVDVVAKQSERGDWCADILVEKTRLTLSASFVAALARFLGDATPECRDDGCDNLGYVGDTLPKCKTENSSCSDHVHDRPIAQQRGVSLSLQLRRPEVAILAGKSVGLVARCELLLDYSRCLGRDELVLRLAGLRVTSVQPAPTVMKPCDVEVVRNITNGGALVKMAIGAVDLTLCSATFTASATIVEEFVAALKDRREVPACPLAHLLLMDDLWSAKKIAPCCEATLCGPLTEQSQSEPHSFPAGCPAESMSITVAKVTVVLGIQSDVICRPLFIVKALMKLQAHDWSSAPAINGEAQVQASCWNDDLQTWEPLLEPWTWSLTLYQSKALPISPCTSRPPKLRRSQDNVPTKAASESSGDESEPGMTFLKPEHFHLGRDLHMAAETLADCSDSETDGGALEQIRSAVAHLFVGAGGSTDGESSSEEVETESGSSESCQSPATERAVFLNKHADSVDSGLETETVDRQATHVLFEASRLELTVSPNTLEALELLRVEPLHHVGRPLANHLGPGSIITIIKEGAVVATCGFDEESPPSTPGSLSPCPSPSRDSSTSGDSGRVSPDLMYPRESLDELLQRVRGSQLTVRLPGFEDVTLPLGKAVGVRAYPVFPVRHGLQHHVLVHSCRTDGISHYAVTGPLQIKNDTSYALGIYYKKSVLLALGEATLGESLNPFDDMVRLAVVAPDDRFHVPLTVSYHCQLHFLPVHLTTNSVSADGVSWQETRNPPDTSRDLICSATDGPLFCLKASWVASNGPQRIVRITPPWLLRNVLPCACELGLPAGQRVRLEAGEEASVYSIDPRQACSITIEVPDYMGQPWSGTLALSPDVRDKTVTMATEHDTDGGNKQLALCVLVSRDSPATILLYAPYWLLNKTGLTLQIRGSGSDIIQECAGLGPLLFCYRKQRARTVRLRVLTSSWSSAFSLEPVGCSGMIVCRDRERGKRYRVVIQCEPSHVQPALCRILTFLPSLLVENACKKHLRFMEDNERADLWHDITPGQCTPFWPDTDSLRMVVRLRDSKHISPPFPVGIPHTTALRMDKGCALTVEVTGGEGNPLRVLLRPYRMGDAPVRIDNHCADLFLKFRQKDCPQVALLSPYHSLLYTWDDACKERELLWSVYNNAARELRAQLMRDGCGEERVSFRSVRVPATNSANVRQRSPTSSPSSDSESEPPAATSVLKDTRKDTVVVYWTSFLQRQQRVLLLTQDERLARRARRAVEAERSGLELFVSLAGCHLSLCNQEPDGAVRELAYGSVLPAVARWELSVAQRWKPLPVELAAWLENNYTHGILQPIIKDYIHVDLVKMQMSKPLFGGLRRRQRPALWVQYRASPHLGVFRATIHRLQIDDQRPVATTPCVLIAAPGAGAKPALEAAMLWRQRASGETAIKSLSIATREHRLHVDTDWLTEVCGVVRRLGRRQDAQAAIRLDIAQLHKSLAHLANAAEELLEELLVVEQLHCGELALDLTLVHSSAATSLAFSPMTTPWPVPDVLAGLLGAVATAPAPIAGLPIKLCGMEISGGSWSLLSLRNRLAFHYRTQLLQQLHVLLLGVPVLATPCARLATRLPTAVEEGAVLPEEFSDAVVAEAEVRLKERAVAGRETGLPRGLATASRAFPLGCVLGLSGLAVGVARGPPSLGLDAFCRGPGRAVAGLLVALQNDVKGLPDKLVLLSDSIARSMALGGNVMCRARPPRYINPIMGLRPFSMLEAQGLALLDMIGRGRYAKDVYWAHGPLKPTHSSVLLLTLQRVLVLDQVGNSSMLNITWISPWNAVQSAKVVDQDLIFTVTQGVEVLVRQIPCWDPEVLLWLHCRVQEAITLQS